MTGRRLIAYVPGVLGARTWNVNVPNVPGATTVSAWTAGRVVYGHPTESAAHMVLSPLIPSRASWPGVPFTQLWLPALRNWMESGPLTSPGRSVGYADCDAHALW